MSMQTSDTDTTAETAETEPESRLSRIFIRSLLRALAATLPKDDHTTAEISADMWEMARELFFAMQPNDAIEAVYAARAVAAHFAAMDMYARAAKPDLTNEKALRLRNSAIAASRSFDSALRRMEQRQTRPVARSTYHAAQPAMPPTRLGAHGSPNQAPPTGWRARFHGRPASPTSPSAG